jgi:hypothetical protein
MKISLAFSIPLRPNRVELFNRNTVARELMVGCVQKGQSGFHHKQKRHAMKLLKNPGTQSVKTLFLFGFTSLVAATTLFGQISFDEFGNTIGLPHGFVGVDPSGGITNSPVLMFNLPFGVVPGDVLLTDQVGTTNQQFSDVVRFWNPTGSPNQSLIIFYSDLTETNEIPPLADVGLPKQLQTLVVGPFLEVGTEGTNHYDYTATLFLPGAGAAGPIIYHIVSDGIIVPEPNNCSLVVLGGGLLFALKRRFKSNRK